MGLTYLIIQYLLLIDLTIIGPFLNYIRELMDPVAGISILSSLIYSWVLISMLGGPENLS